MNVDAPLGSLPVLDRAVFDGLRAFGCNGIDVTERYVRLFLSEAEALFARVQRAGSSDDRAAVERAAHTLRGAAGFIGVSRLAEAAGALEDAARQQTGPLSQLLAGLEAAYAEATAALRHEIPAN